jgi:undecaprenyl pyrophosphate phosphatase UppP
MSHALRNRFWIETILGSATGVLAIVTLFWHDWIETVFGVDPDKGNGSAEWLVVVILVVVTLTLAVGVRFEWRRARMVPR